MSQTERKPGYYAILTAEVRYDKNLTADEKLLYAEITALTQMNGACYAPNSYFAELFSCEERTIRRRLEKLEKSGYIERIVIYKDGTREIEKRFIKLSCIAEDRAVPTPGQNCPHPEDRAVRYINNPTDSNNIYNPDISSLRSDISVPLEKEKPKKAKKEVSPDLLAQFEKWYRYYPLKKSKQPALEKFVKILQNKEATFDELMWGVQCYAEEINLKQTESRYIKHPTTWLNQKCWQDDYEDLFRDIRVEIPDCSQGGY